MDKGILGDAKNKDEFYEILCSAYVKEKIFDKLGLVKITTNSNDENMKN